MTVRLIVCGKCRCPGGTLRKVTKDTYEHLHPEECIANISAIKKAEAYRNILKKESDEKAKRVQEHRAVDGGGGGREVEANHQGGEAGNPPDAAAEDAVTIRQQPDRGPQT